MAFSGLSRASSRLTKEELETLVGRVMDISFCHHRVPFVDKLFRFVRPVLLTVNLYLAVSLPFPQG